jgi:hypothetical protein
VALLLFKFETKFRDLKFFRTSYKTIPAWRDSKGSVRVSWSLSHARRSSNRAYGNEFFEADGAGEGFPSRGCFNIDNIRRTFTSSDSPVASSSALAAPASRI